MTGNHTNATPGRLLLAYAGVGVLTLSWLVANHYPPWLAAHSDFLAACSIWIVLLSGLTVARIQGVHLPRVALFFFALASIPLLQFAAGLIYFFGDAWIASLYLIAAGLAAVASARAMRLWNMRWVEALAGAMLTGALASLLIALMQRFDTIPDALGLYVSPLPPGKAPFGNLAQPNQLNTLFGLGLVSLWLLFERRRASAAFSLAAALLLVSGMAMTLSRTSILLFVALGICREVLRRRVPMRMPGIVLAGLASLWLGLFILWPHVAEWVDMSTGPSVADRIRAGPRVVMWEQLADALRMKPLWGYGWNQINVAQLSVVAHYPDSRFTLHSHNLVLDVLIWNGIPLGVLVLVVAARWLVARVRRIVTLEGGLALGVVALLLAHALVEYPLDYLYFLTPFGMMLGVLSVDVAEVPAAATSVLPAPIVLTLCAALIVVTSVDYWRMEDAFRETRFEAARIGPSRAVDLEPAVLTEFTQLEARRRLLVVVPRPGMSAAQLQWMGEVTRRYSTASMLYRYALAQALNANFAGAEMTLRRLEQLHGTRQLLAAQRELRKLSETDYPQLRALSFLH